MLFNIIPEHEFGAELQKISSDLHRFICLNALDQVPDYFWVIPSSSSGKYHPRNDLGIGGNVKHTKAVFWIGEELLSHPSCPFEDLTKNDIRVAMLLHDSLKQGEGKGTGHTVVEHPLLPRKVLRPWNEGDEESTSQEIVDAWDRICSLIESHMGCWTKDKQGNEILDVPNTEAQKFVHMADYLASRKSIEVDVTQYLASTTKSPDTSWRGLPAKQSQIDYINILYVKCNTKGVNLDKIPFVSKDLKRGIASDIIQELLKLLGE